MTRLLSVWKAMATTSLSRLKLPSLETQPLRVVSLARRSSSCGSTRWWRRSSSKYYKYHTSNINIQGGGGVLPQRQGAVPRVGVGTSRTTSHAPPEWQPKCNQVSRWSKLIIQSNLKIMWQAQLAPGLHSNDRRGCKAVDREGSSAWILFPSRRHPLERVRHSWHRRHQNVSLFPSLTRQ